MPARLPPAPRGNGRVFGVTDANGAVDIYSGYVGPTLATHAGPLSLNASYRLGYVKVDDHSLGGLLDEDFDDFDLAQRCGQRRHGAGPAAVRLHRRRRLCP